MGGAGRAEPRRGEHGPGEGNLSSSPLLLLLSPLAQAHLERSLSRYAGVVPTEGLAALRDILEDAITTHPVAVRLLDHLRERGAPDSSGTVPKEGADAARDAKTGDS